MNHTQWNSAASPRAGRRRFGHRLMIVPSLSNGSTCEVTNIRTVENIRYGALRPHNLFGHLSEAVLRQEVSLCIFARHEKRPPLECVFIKQSVHRWFISVAKKVISKLVQTLLSVVAVLALCSKPLLGNENFAIESDS